ncbi:UNVERIFIED_CONTAM: hypothetical protein PYX00_002168 [Menopon gallinae]|uniref:Uncharacterized protein n=1 Tax=Menopon gallinae TaxID=328185 RepID=A0AAW2IFW3_9NEOP
MLIKTTIRPPGVTNATSKICQSADNNNVAAAGKVRLVVLGSSKVGKSGESPGNNPEPFD